MAMKVAGQVNTQSQMPLEEYIVMRLREFLIMSGTQLGQMQDGYRRRPMSEFDVALDKLIAQGLVGMLRVFTGRKVSVTTMYYLKANEEPIRELLQRNGVMVVDSVK